MRKPKILVVGSSLKDKGGIVSVIKNIESSSVNDDYKCKRIETYITGSVYKRVYIFLEALMKLIWILISFRPDIVHIHMSEKGSFYRKAIILLISKLFNRIVILHMHSASFDDFYNSNKFQKILIKNILNKADRVIVLSKEWEQYYSNIVPLDKISVLYNAVYWINRDFSRNSSNPIGLFLGRLGRRKGTYDLIFSIKELKKNEINCKFYFAGDGEVDQVKRQISEDSLDEMIDVLGWVNSDQIHDLLEKVDYLVLPSYNEGLPMAILEAMNFGLPIISTNVGGIPEVIIDKDNGYLVKPGDTAALTKALRSLITNSQIRYEMGKKNREIIHNHFDMKIFVRDLSNIYESLIKI